MESVSEVRPFDLNPGLPWPIATIIPHIYFLEPFTVVTHPVLERADLKTFPVRAFLVASPSRTVWLCRCPIISFVFDTLRFSVCIHIRVRLLYQSTSRLLHILFCSLPQNPWSPTMSFVLSGSIVVPPSLLYLMHRDLFSNFKSVRPPLPVAPLVCPSLLCYV